MLFEDLAATEQLTQAAKKSPTKTAKLKNFILRLNLLMWLLKAPNNSLRKDDVGLRISCLCCVKCVAKHVIKIRERVGWAEVNDTLGGCSEVKTFIEIRKPQV